MCGVRCALVVCGVRCVFVVCVCTVLGFSGNSFCFIISDLKHWLLEQHQYDSTCFPLLIRQYNQMPLSNVKFPGEKQIAKFKSSASNLRHNSDRQRPALPWAKVTDRRVHFACVKFWPFFAHNCLTAPAGGPSAPDRVVLPPPSSPVDLVKSFLFRYLPTQLAAADCVLSAVRRSSYAVTGYLSETVCIRREF